MYGIDKELEANMEVIIRDTQDPAVELVAQLMAKAIRLKPKYAEAYLDRALAYGDLGQNERAIQDFSTAISLSPDNGEAYLFRGMSYLEQKKYFWGYRDAKKASELGEDKLLEWVKNYKIKPVIQNTKY